jgi:ABC-2 type transport system ATP-binding protein
MLQETRLYKKFSVGETLDLFASFYDGETFQNEVTERLSLGGILSKRLESLSGGQLQRVYLACALVHRPKLIFLDEPSNGLDPQSRRELWKILNEYKGRGASLVLTSHFMHEAEALADNILILDRGKCLATGTTTELISSYTRGHRLEIRYKDKLFLEKFSQAFKIDPSEKFEKITEQSLAYYFSDPIDFMERVTAFSKPFKEEISSFSLAQTTLEDVYLYLTGHGLRESK